jgi:hypothetical protein
MNPQFLSPILPSKIEIMYRGRRCTGLASDTVPLYYVKSIDITTVTGQVYSTFINGGFTKRFHTTMNALFAVGNSTPTNQTALDALALRFAKDYWIWLSSSYNITYNGIIVPDPDGTIDEIQWLMRDDESYTQVYSSAWNGQAEELMHADTASNACIDSNNSGNPTSKYPYIEFYGPPGVCTSGHPVLTRYRMVTIDGRDRVEWVSNDVIS